MDYPLSIAFLRTRFRLAIQQDDFCFNLAYNTEFGSVRSLIRYLAAGQFGSLVSKEKSEILGFDDIDMTLGKLLSCSILHQSEEMPVASLVLKRFCLEPIRLIAQDALRAPDRCPDPQTLFEEVGVSTGGEWVAALASGEMAEKVSVLLFKDFLTALQHRTLYSFFIVPGNPNGFSTIGDECHSGIGTPLKSLVRSSKSGTATVTLSRYDEDVGTDAVAAYEWHATLRSYKQNVDEAQACGMVYVFRGRDRGIPIGDRTDLVAAADAVADIDVLQVRGFLTQNVDAESLLLKSDPCFVWLWERRDNAEKGLGAECLREALDLLQKRFRYLRTVVLNIKPLQFVEWEEADELPTIVLEKQNATESIMAYIQKLDLRRFNVRFVHTSEVGNGQAAHLAIAEEFQRNIEE